MNRAKSICGRAFGRRALLCVVGLLAVAACGPAASQAVGPLGAKTHVDFLAITPDVAVTNQLLVKYAGPVSPLPPEDGSGVVHSTALSGLHDALGGKVEHQFRLIPWQLVTIPSTMSLAVAAKHYAGSPDVLYVEPNYYVYPQDTRPDDPRYGELWGMERIHAPQAWDVTTGNTNIVVAVIDTGILRTHKDLVANMWTNPDEVLDGADNDGNGYIDDLHGWDFANNDNNPTDDNGHGTHVAGTIGAVGNNGTGVAGVNWNVKIVAIKFLGLNGGSTANAIKSVEYVAAMAGKIHLSNNSWGGGGYSAALEAAIAQSAAANQLFLAAAGNDATDNDVGPHYPSNYEVDNVISVASIAEGGALSSFSNYGRTTVDIAAPGSAILSTWNTGVGDYNTISGTSMATPHVAGAAALLLGMAPEATYQELRAALLDTARPNPALVNRCVTESELDLAAAIVQFGSSLVLDRQAYQSSATVSVTLEDLGNTNSMIELPVFLYDSDFVSLAAPGTLLATSTVPVFAGASTTLLTNQFDLAAIFTPVPEHGDTLVVSYTNNAEPLYAVAPIDDLPPVVTNLRIESLTERDGEVVWETDEATDQWVWFGNTLPPPVSPEYGSAEFTGLGSGATSYTHRVHIEGLSALTLYYAGVRSADPAGNVTQLPASAGSTVAQDYLRFFTPLRVTVLWDDMESGVQRWTTDGYADDWELGQPKGGPGAAYSGQSCWGTNLDGPYDAPVNAWLVSKPIAVRTGTRLAFAVWYDILYSSTSRGVVEVNNGHGWINVTPNSRFAGDSGFWRTMDIDLSAFDSSTVQVRFRLESANEGGFGYYVDDVRVSTLMPPGMNVLAISDPLDDAPAYAAANNGDGTAQFGETVKLRFQIMNMTLDAYAGVYANVSSPSDAADMMPDPAHLEYGTLATAQSAWSDVAVTIEIADLLELSAMTLPLFHTVGTTSGTSTWTDVVQLPVNRLYSLAGTVTNTDGEPVGGATVELSGWGAGTRSTTTDATNGTYRLDGLAATQRYDLKVSLDGAYLPHQERIIGGATTTRDIVLRRAFIEPVPAALAVTVAPGASVGTTLRLANTNTLADTAARFSLRSSFDGHPTLSVSFPMEQDTVVLAPGAATNVAVTVTAGAVSNGEYPGTVTVVNIDAMGFVGTGDLAVPLVITVDGPGLPVAELVEVTVADSDGDGDPEPGETLLLTVRVRNSGTAAINGLTAAITVSGAATMTQPAVVYASPLAPGATDTGSAPASAVLDTDAVGGEVASFRILLSDTDGHTWTEDYVVTVDGSLQISGSVTDTAASPLPGLNLTAQLPDGRFAEATTDSSGDYAFNDLQPGTWSVMVSRSGTNALSAVHIVPLQATDVSGVDFVLGGLDISYGPAGFEFVVDEGRSASLPLTVTNALGHDIRISPKATGDDAVVLATASLPTGSVAPAAAQEPSYPVVNWSVLTAADADMESVIVHLDPAAAALDDDALAAALGMPVVRRFKLIPACVVKVPAGSSPMALAAAFDADPLVRFTEPNHRLSLNAELPAPRREPDDPDYLAGTLWGLDNQGQDGGTADFDIDAPEAWSLTQGSTSVVVCVVDTGVNYNHDDLAANMWQNPGETGLDTNGVDRATNGIDDDGNGYVDDVYGINAITGSGDPMDDNGHGTHCAGTIGAVGNNAIGVVGVNWNTRIMACKFLAAVGGGTTEDAIVALEYAIINGAKVVNNSWGGGPANAALQSVMAVGQSSNVLMMCAAGNDGVNNDVSPHYPSSYELDNIISVAASDRNGNLADFSNYGKVSVDIAAPGVDIYSTSYLGGYESMSGTSMATPHAAGVATLIWGYMGVETPWTEVRDALYKGIVADPAYDGVVSRAGHLNAFRSLSLPPPSWLAFVPTDKTVPASGSAALDVVANPDLDTAAGHYYGQILVDKLLPETAAQPVHLSVMPAPVPGIAHVTLDDSAPNGDGDGVAEPGETVAVYLTLMNRGSLMLPACTGILTTGAAGVTLTDTTTQWPMLESGDTVLAGQPATVHFDEQVSGVVPFGLSISDGSRAPWTNVTFSIEVNEAYGVTGQVTSVATGDGIAGARVEMIGEAGAVVYTDAQGCYRFTRVPDGRYKLRAVAEGYTRSDWQRVELAGADAGCAFVLPQVAGSVSPSEIEAVLLSGTDLPVDLTVTNAGNAAWQSRAYKLTPLKVLLLSDHGSLDALAGLISNMGAQCTVRGNNALTGLSQDVANLVPYDIVIADFAGSDGTGRVLDYAEGAALYDYVKAGGRLVLTGMTPVASADHFLLDWLFEIESGGLQELPAKQGQIAGSGDLLDGPFVSVAPGTYVPVTDQVYEEVAPDAWGSNAELILTVNASAKVLRTPVVFGNGESVLWTGNPDAVEWLTAGVLQDLFKNLLLGWMDEDNVDWVEVPTDLQTAFAGDSTTLRVRINGAYPGLGSRSVQLSILLAGNVAGTPDLLIPLRATVESRNLTVSTAEGVTDWLGQPLAGNGDEGSSLFQLIFAGPDGIRNPPQPGGGPGGDDVVLQTALSRDSFSRFGTGRELQPDFGLFLETFLLSRFEVSEAYVYIRAWDAGSFAEAVAYGDSALYRVKEQAGEIWVADGWTVDRVPGYPGDSLDELADHDGDSIPDGWNVAFRLDARRPVAPLPAGWVQLAKVGSIGSGSTQFNTPARVAISSNHVFVADMLNHRVRVFNRSLSTLVTTYGGTMGSGAGQLKQPAGLAYDRASQRLVIADSGNHRVVVLAVDPLTGALTAVTTFGAYGTGDGQFNAPYDIGFSPTGRILVADTLSAGAGNHRIQVFSADGVFVRTFGTLGNAAGQLNRPFGVFGGADGLFYVADSANNRIQCFGGTGTSLWRFGTEGSGTAQFRRPYDMTADPLGNLLVVDSLNHRLQLLDISTYGAPAWTASFGSFGTAAGQLSNPQGVATDVTGGEVYVADTGNHRVLRMRLIVDSDGDGMDDYWEQLHGLDWRDAADAMRDADGDGVFNIGEYRLDTDPNRRDSNDDGLSDGWALARAADPVAVFPPHAGVGVSDAGIEAGGDVLTWSASAGVPYRIELSTDLLQAEWRVQDTVTVSQTGMTSWTNSVPPSSSRYFYRIRQEL